MEKEVEEFFRRRRIQDEGCFQWHLDMIPDTLVIDGQERQNPAKSSAIFVVHGMGEQEPADTAALLRSGFDDALASIHQWQFDNQQQAIPKGYFVPPPYILDGYWGDYFRVDQTFPKDWKKFSPGQQNFFSKLWAARTQSRFAAFRWGLRQLTRLLNPLTMFRVSPLAWFIYLPYQVSARMTLYLSVVKAPRILTGFLGDLRLYFNPQGVTERAIVQRTDECVATSFMRLLGLDRNFRSLDQGEYYSSSNKPVRFNRIVWVAHSLGSVISYNVLSDLFYQAAQIEQEHARDSTRFEQEYRNVQLFRKSLRRFITIGSPLDKVAFLYGKRALTPWPTEGRTELLDGGEDVDRREWWVNFYSVMDPVSGPLTSRLICGDSQPLNYHVSSSLLPGYAHVGYWKDSTVLRYILGRTYGRDLLHDRTPRPWPTTVLGLLALGFHLVNFSIALTIVLTAIWLFSFLFGISDAGLPAWASQLLKAVF